MLFGIISDTHIPDRANNIPKSVYDIFKDVDTIIHCGDITSKKVLVDLDENTPAHELIAVKGNMDKLDLPKNIFLTVENYNIGIIHGNQINPRGDLLKMKYYCLENNLDILISGHTHIPLIEKINIPELEKEILLLNPGSPTIPKYPLKTVMTLEINKNNIIPRLICVDNLKKYEKIV